jgi:hypothetical protein
MVTLGPVVDPDFVKVGRWAPEGVEEQQLTAAGGWCAPTEIIYGTPAPPISPTGVVPEMADVLDLRNQEILDRWDQEDEWLRDQIRLSRTPAPLISSQDHARMQAILDRLTGIVGDVPVQ